MKRAGLWGRISLALAVLALSAGCRSFDIKTQAGFVELSGQESYGYRALTADGVVIGVRVVTNDPDGPLSFWVRSIENRMRSRGYAQLRKTDVRSTNGTAGVRIDFGHDEGAQPHRYTVVVYATPAGSFGKGKVYLIEAGATKSLWDQSSSAIDSAIGSFETR